MNSFVTKEVKLQNFTDYVQLKYIRIDSDLCKNTNGMDTEKPT